MQRWRVSCRCYIGGSCSVGELVAGATLVHHEGIMLSLAGCPHGLTQRYLYLVIYCLCSYYSHHNLYSYSHSYHILIIYVSLSHMPVLKLNSQKEGMMHQWSARKWCIMTTNLGTMPSLEYYCKIEHTKHDSPFNLCLPPLWCTCM